MKQRLIRKIVPLLIAGQLILSAPIVSAMADMMPATTEMDSCPCCPEDEMGEAACLGACLASVGATTSHSLPAAQSTSDSRLTPMDVRVPRLSETPLKPPPIY